MHAVVDQQDTLSNAVGPQRAGLGIARIDHRFPFQCSDSGLELLPLYGSPLQKPTAMHIARVRHDTLDSTLWVEPSGLGVG